MTDVSANANPSNLAAQTRKKVSNGTGNFELLQSDEQVDFQSISGTYSQSEIEAIRDALVTAGIMKPS